MQFEFIFNILNDFKNEWKNAKNIKMKQITGGISNQIYMISADNVETILIRIYGKKMESLINRNDEINIFQFVSNYQVAPKLLGLFEGGRFEEYIDAKPLDEKDIIKFRNKIIEKIKKINIMPFSGSLICWKRLFEWNQILKNKKIYDYNDEINQLKNKMNEYPNNHLFFKKVFCHNDLLPSNILVDKNENIHFIDYEYAGINYLGMELANHVIYYDFENIKNKNTEIILFLESYFERKLNNLDIELINYFIKITYLTWMIWGQISCDDDNKEIDFNYQKYVDDCKRNYYLF